MSHLVTCHDMLAIESARGLIPQHRTGWTGRILQAWILSGLKRAASIICVSEETRERLLALAPELAGRSRTIENGLAYPFSPMPLEQVRPLLAKLGLNPEVDRFFFHVGGNQWYKNREGVIRIFSRFCVGSTGQPGSLPIKLVLAGKSPH